MTHSTVQRSVTLYIDTNEKFRAAADYHRCHGTCAVQCLLTQNTALKPAMAMYRSHPSTTVPGILYVEVW